MDRKVVTPKMLQESSGSLLDDVEDDLEAVVCAAIRIGDLVERDVRGKVEQRTYPRRRRRASGQGPQVTQIALVHGEHVVELLKIVGHDASGSVAGQIVASRLGGAGGARIGALADVIGVRTRRLHLDEVGEIRLLDHRSHDGFGGRRATDVAETDEEDPLHAAG